MKLLKHLKIIIPSFIFFTMMEIFFENSASFDSLIVLLLISVLSAFWITKYKFLPIILTSLFSLGSILFLLILGDISEPSLLGFERLFLQQENAFQHFYIISSSIIFAFSLIGLERFFLQQEKWMEQKEVKLNLLDSGYNLNQTIMLISIFLISSGSYGIYIILDFPAWIIMLIIFLSIFFSTLYLTKINFIKSKASGIHLNSAKNKTFNLYSFLLGFIMLELVWALSFWPASHLVIGSIILSAYYCFWNILKIYLKNEFSRKTVFLNLSFFIIFIGLIILIQDWQIK